MKHTIEYISSKNIQIKMERVITKLKSHFNLTDEEVKERLCAEFDLDQWIGEHHTITVIIHGYEFEIDEKLAKLFKLMNKYDLVTSQSCQHNWFGWASISFSSEGYLKFLNKILEKIGSDVDRDKVYEMDIIKRYEVDTREKNKRMFCLYALYEGRDQFVSNVVIEFLQSEIPKMEKELEELFDDE